MKLLLVSAVACVFALSGCNSGTDNNAVIESPNVEENTSPATTTGIQDNTNPGNMGPGTGAGTGTGQGMGTGTGTGTGTSGDTGATGTP